MGMQFRNITVKAKNIINQLNEKNKLRVHFWSPGYTIPINCQRPHPDDPSQIINIKKFYPANTTEAAVIAITERSMSYIFDQQIEFLKKAHVSPGHISMTAGAEYLSIGPVGGKPLNPSENQEIFFVESIESDKEGFGLGLDLEIDKREPEMEIELKSLELEKIIKFIKEIKNNKQVAYNVLGDRWFQKENANTGYSCATIVYECLNKGGFSSKMPFLRNILLENSILTPAILINAVKALGKTELELQNKDRNNRNKLKPH